MSIFRKIHFLNMEINEFSFNEFLDFWMPLNVDKYVAPARAHYRPQTQKSSHTNLTLRQ